MVLLTTKQRAVFQIVEVSAYERTCREAEGAAPDAPLGTLPAADISDQLLRILIVDDHRATADTLTALVKIWGHDVRLAYDGATGLSLAAAFSPDVLLLDMLMPDMSGFEVARQIRRQDRFHDCFLIAITGRTDESHRCQCYEAGVDLCLIKPVVPTHLETLLMFEAEYVLSRQNRARQRAARFNQRSNSVRMPIVSGIVLQET